MPHPDMGTGTPPAIQTGRRFPWQIVFSFLVILCAATSGGQGGAPSDDADPFRISVNVKRVALSVAIRDENGAGVKGLEQSDFEIYEDGKLQSLREFRYEDVPAAIGLIVDNSGSMQFRDRDVIQAAEALVAALVPKSEMFVIHFNTKVRFGLPPGIAFSRDQTTLNRAVENYSATGYTALYDAIGEGLRHLEQSKALRKVLVVLSDGGDNRSLLSLGAVTQLADISGAVIYGIGIHTRGDSNWSPGALRSLSRRTGGEVYFPRRAIDIEDAYALVARDLREQYTLVYSPGASPSKRRFHRIHVQVRHAADRKLKIRTRAGYYDGASSVPAAGQMADAGR